MLAFAFASLLIELTPGPNMAYLATVALSHSRRVAMMAVMGVAVGLFLSGLAVAFGLALVDPAVLVVLRYAGIVYLLWLAFDTWREPRPGREEELTSFGRGLLTNLLNPKAFAFYVSVMPGFMPIAAMVSPMGTLPYVAIYVVIATAVHAGIVLAASSLRPVLESSGPRQIVRRMLAFGLVAVAIWFAWTTK